MTEFWAEIDIHSKIQKYYYLFMKNSVYKSDDTNLQFFYLLLHILCIAMECIGLSDMLQFVC